MSDLKPADTESVVEVLAYALQFDGRRRVHHADAVMARVTAGRLAEHLAEAGYVVMKREGGVAPSTSGMPRPHEQTVR